MLRFLWYLRGYDVLEITGASVEWALNGLTASCLPFWNIRQIDPLTVRICIFRGYVKNAAEICLKSMCVCHVIETHGALQDIKGIFLRPILLISVVISILSVFILSEHILFYEVIGNDSIPDEQILRELHSSGAGFFTKGIDIYPRKLRNHMIEAIPELQWLTVTQHGCRANVIVRERPEQPMVSAKKGFANIVASHGGVITNQSILAGQAQRQIGDTVVKGDLLVSGVVDLERVYTLEYARAEIFAKTWRKSDVSIPKNYGKKRYMDDQKYGIWLIVGRHRIKIFGNSGISHSSCDKMITKYDLILPQNLRIPLSLEMESCRSYTEELIRLDAVTAEMLLQVFTDQNTLLHMQAGQILSRTSEVVDLGAVYQLHSILECHEMIAETIELKQSNEEVIHD